MKDNGLKLPKHYIERYLIPKVNLLTHNILQYKFERIQDSRGRGAKCGREEVQKCNSVKVKITEIEMLTLGSLA
jgi:hypothetical protein